MSCLKCKWANGHAFPRDEHYCSYCNGKLDQRDVYRSGEPIVCQLPVTQTPCSPTRDDWDRKAPPVFCVGEK